MYEIKRNYHSNTKNDYIIKYFLLMLIMRRKYKYKYVLNGLLK